MILYLAHPLGDNVPKNAANAVRWLHLLMEYEPEVSFNCPWLPYVQVYDLHFAKDGLPEQDHPFRQRCLRDDVRIAASCDGIVLVGGRVSTGMALERDAVVAKGGLVCDLTFFGYEPPLRIDLYVRYGIGTSGGGLLARGIRT